MCFLTICISFFVKALFSSFAYFFTGSLNFGEFSFLSSMYILVISPLSDVQLTKIFSHSVGSTLPFQGVCFAWPLSEYFSSLDFFFKSI
jgi:hypothetical protein